MRPLLFVALCLVACKGPDPTTPTEVPAPAASSATPAPKKIRVKADGVAFLDAENAPGVLIDANAPPPPPGSAPAKHPFVTATCYGGKPQLCSKARELLLASKSWEEFVGSLRAAGFELEAH